MNSFPIHQQYDCQRLCQVSPRGWMKQQMQDDLEHGFAGRLDELCKLASSRIFTENHATTVEATESSMVEAIPRGWWDGETQA
ncbi:MAG: hypothetical protein HN919_05140, partial [Verrucomicrobia bacterium]|nr:hypothetical protein [Verrucomicrobiota bacterium]